jgi:hypothetical protein
MKATTAALAVSWTIAVACACAARAEEAPSAALAHRLMVRSGMSVQLRGLPRQMEADLKRAEGQLDGRVLKALLSASKSAFRAESLEADMRARLAKKLTVPDMHAALRWLESPAGERVTRAEELSAVSLDEERLAEYLHGLARKPLARRRMDAFSSLLRATNATESVRAAQEAIALGVAVGADRLQPVERQLGAERIREQVESMLPSDKVEALLSQQLPLMFAYMYRDVSDADLSAYLRFLRSAAGRRYQDAMTDAFVESLGRASLQVGEEIVERQRQVTM